MVVVGKEREEVGIKTQPQPRERGEKGITRRQFIERAGRLIAVSLVGASGGAVLAWAEQKLLDWQTAEYLKSLGIETFLPMIRKLVVVPEAEGVVSAVRKKGADVSLQLMVENNPHLPIVTASFIQARIDGQEAKDFLFKNPDASKGYRSMEKELKPENYWQTKNLYAICLHSTPNFVEIAAIKILPGVTKGREKISIALRTDDNKVLTQEVYPWQIIFEPKTVTRIKDGELMLDESHLTEEVLKLRNDDPDKFNVIKTKAESVFRGENTGEYVYFREFYRNAGLTEKEIDYAIGEFTRESLINRFVSWSNRFGTIEMLHNHY